MPHKEPDVDVARYAEMLAALGTEPRLRIMRLLLSAHPGGLVVGDIPKELGLSSSNLSHHLERLKNEELVKVRRDGTSLWYSANSAALKEVLAFLYSECCTRNLRHSREMTMACSPKLTHGFRPGRRPNAALQQQPRPLLYLVSRGATAHLNEDIHIARARLRRG